MARPPPACREWLEIQARPTKQTCQVLCVACHVVSRASGWIRARQRAGEPGDFVYVLLAVRSASYIGGGGAEHLGRLPNFMGASQVGTLHAVRRDLRLDVLDVEQHAADSGVADASDDRCGRVCPNGTGPSLGRCSCESAGLFGLRHQATLCDSRAGQPCPKACRAAGAPRVCVRNRTRSIDRSAVVQHRLSKPFGVCIVCACDCVCVIVCVCV